MAQLGTSREVEGFDGHVGNSTWWFEAWGSGPRNQWNRRDEAGKPTPRDLRSADYIVIGIQRPNGQIIYRTHTGGLDLDPRSAGGK